VTLPRYGEMIAPLLPFASSMILLGVAKSMRPARSAVERCWYIFLGKAA